uniref:Uncharacterized protein n=1 Tax=Megaselia scalaris TaxID=36166 RepID=T1GFS9_MEGSC
MVSLAPRCQFLVPMSDIIADIGTGTNFRYIVLSHDMVGHMMVLRAAPEAALSLHRIFSIRLAQELSKVDQICYSVLCVFSYVAAGQDNKKNPVLYILWKNNYGKQREEENISKLRGSLFHNSICTESQFNIISLIYVAIDFNESIFIHA